jgi:hypothetical protein
MSAPRYTEEGAKFKQSIVDLFNLDPEVGSKTSRQKNIVVQTPDDEIMRVLEKIKELGLPPDKAAQAISNFESQTFLDYRPVPWDEIHHQRGLDIFGSARNLPVSERPKALDLMDKTGHTLGDTRNNLLGTSFDVRTHLGTAFKGKTNDGKKVRDVLKLNPGITELSAHPFGSKESRPGVIVPDYDNANQWVEHATKSAKTVEIDAARGIAIEQPRRQIVNNILQNSRKAPPIESFDIFQGSPREIRDAAAFFGNKNHERARLAVYGGWRMPTNLDPALIPEGMTKEQFQAVAQYFPADMLKTGAKFGAALPVLGAVFDGHSAIAGTHEAATSKSNRGKAAGVLDAISGATGLAALAPTPATLPLAAVSAGSGLLSTAVRNKVDQKVIKAAVKHTPTAVRAVNTANKALNPVSHQITSKALAIKPVARAVHAAQNEVKFRGKQLLSIFGIK